MSIRFLISVVILQLHSLMVQAEKLSEIDDGHNLFEKLQGKWSCNSVNSNSGLEDQSRANKYLRFHFVKKSLYISEAPFDIGYQLPFKIKNNAILVLTDHKNLIEYKVDFISTDSLVLNLRGDSGYDSDIIYHFKRTLNEVYGDRDKIALYNFALIIFDIRGNFPALKSISDSSVYPKTDFHYLISNQDEYHLASPLFIQRENKNFAMSFLSHFDRMNAIDVDSLNNELIIEFEVVSKKVINIKILNNISYKLSSHVFDILTKTQKHWRVTSATSRSKIRFSFSIFRGNIRDIPH